MSQVPDDSHNQQQRMNGHDSVFRKSVPLIVSSIATICCLFVLIGGFTGLLYSSSYFSDWTEATATIVGAHKMGEFEHSGEKIDPFNNDFNAKYCPEIQFRTVGDDTRQNITTVLESDCEEYAGDIVVGDMVDILYDPSNPARVLDAHLPTVVEVAMICVMSISAMCSCCYVVVGIIFYKAIEARNKHNHGHEHTAHPHTSNQPPLSSVQMTNINGHDSRGQYASTDPNQNHNTSTTSSTTSVQPTTPPSVIPVVPLDEIQAYREEDPPMVSVYPEGTPTGTAIAVGDAAPPIVGCTLIPPNPPSNQQYVNPSTLPLHTPTSSLYVSPSDIHEAIASA